jgi:S1-C subfamily serine protease
LCAFAVLVLFAGCTIGAGPNRQDLSATVAASFTKVASIEAFDQQNHSRPFRRSSGSAVLIYANNDFSLVATNMHVISSFDEKRGDNGEHVFYNFIDIINWPTGLLHGEYDTQNINALSAYTTRIRIANNGVMDDKVVLYANATADLAIVKYTPPNSHKNRAASLRETPLRVGESAISMGYSFAEFHRVSIGTVSQVFPSRKFTDDKGVERIFEHGFLHDGITIFGNSGGPVFDASGNIIGLNTMTVMMCCDKCTRTTHHCDVPALGFAIATSSRYIASVVNARSGCWGLVGSSHASDCKLC